MAANLSNNSLIEDLEKELKNISFYCLFCSSFLSKAVRIKSCGHLFCFKCLVIQCSVIESCCSFCKVGITLEADSEDFYFDVGIQRTVDNYLNAANNSGLKENQKKHEADYQEFLLKLNEIVAKTEDVKNNNNRQFDVDELEIANEILTGENMYFKLYLDKLKVIKIKRVNKFTDEQFNSENKNYNFDEINEKTEAGAFEEEDTRVFGIQEEEELVERNLLNEDSSAENDNIANEKSIYKGMPKLNKVNCNNNESDYENMPQLQIMEQNYSEERNKSENEIKELKEVFKKKEIKLETFGDYDNYFNCQQRELKEEKADIKPDELPDPASSLLFSRNKSETDFGALSVEDNSNTESTNRERRETEEGNGIKIRIRRQYLNDGQILDNFWQCFK